jgi:hypothetical protein
VEQWFDLHLYLANWGARRLMMRLPARLLDRAKLEPFLCEVDWVKVWASGDNLIVDIFQNEAEAQDDWDDGSGWLAALAPLRGDLLAGDLGLFYLLWLTAVQQELVADDDVEPLLGIGPLTGPLEAFATFFGVDPDVLLAAAERGETCPASTKRRTAGELRIRAREIAEARERAAAERREVERRRQAEEAERARRARLSALRQRGADVWREIDEEIERRNASGYDRAASLLFDLQALAVEEGRQDEFNRRLASVRAAHEKKTKFIERLSRIGHDNDEGGA